MATRNELKLIREMIEDGYDDADISDRLNEMYAESLSAAQEDEPHWSYDDELSMERAGNRYMCDETYERNDAGEYINLM